jgi:hypothetical protein
MHVAAEAFNFAGYMTITDVHMHALQDTSQAAHLHISTCCTTAHNHMLHRAQKGEFHKREERGEASVIRQLAS